LYHWARKCSCQAMPTIDTLNEISLCISIASHMLIDTEVGLITIMSWKSRKERELHES
jgi:hypothetical protein